jgi:hypothetical protein
MRRKTFIETLVGAAAVALLPIAVKRCRTCGAPTSDHLIDCSRELGSSERARTVCFSCIPEARVIDKYWAGYASAMHYHRHKPNCSQCGVGPGFYHVHGRDFEHRVCLSCAPDARDCRRWVRDLR